MDAPLQVSLPSEVESVTSPQFFGTPLACVELMAVTLLAA